MSCIPFHRQSPLLFSLKFCVGCDDNHLINSRMWTFLVVKLNFLTHLCCYFSSAMLQAKVSELPWTLRSVNESTLFESILPSLLSCRALAISTPPQAPQPPPLTWSEVASQYPTNLAPWKVTSFSDGVSHPLNQRDVEGECPKCHKVLLSEILESHTLSCSGELINLFSKRLFSLSASLPPFIDPIQPLNIMS